jgi:Ca-activated chloride channel family protein
MRKLYGRLGLAGMVVATAAALVMQACNAGHGTARRAMTTRSGDRSTPSGGNMNIGLGNFGERRDPPDYGAVPHIDLQRALQASQGGGGSGQSPFREHANGPSPKTDGDIAIGFQNARTRTNTSGTVFNEDWGYFVQFGSADDTVITADGRTMRRKELEARPEVILRPGEELWVIQRTHPRTVAASDDVPGCGSLMTRREEAGGWREVPVPLVHTSVSGRIEGYISSVKVTQKFHNPFDSKIEATYVFPLPEDAAVNDFLMTVGTRTIRGVIREREEAERIYERARRAGHVASLMTQDRPNIFTQAVANIEPGKEIDIDITYLHCLAYRDGAFEFVFPMVVGPRFNPPSISREGTGVGAVAYGVPGASGQQTEVQYLRPHQRSAAEVSLAIEINAGVSIESLESPSHAITVEHDRAAPTLARIKLASGDTIPNRDFVLRYRIAGAATKSAMLTQADDRAGGKGGFFSMLLVPPADLSYIERGPVEVVFLIDCSGSMQGEPIEQAKAAARHALARLDPDDTFQIINFSDAASQLGSEPLDASRRNLDRGLAYLNSLSAGGGTMMMNGVKAALGYRHDPQRPRFVCFLTDGFIGNDPEVLGFVRERLGQSRIMSVGIGSAPNRYLLEGLARLGRGAAAFLSPGDKPEEVMDLFLNRIAHVALTDISIDWAGLEVDDVYPKRLPDLYVGRPVLITGRYTGTAHGPVRVAGRAGRERIRTEIPVVREELTETPLAARSSIASIWARRKIEELSDKATSEDGPRLQASIRRTALDFGLLSSYTAFIAVDSMTRTSGSFGTTVAVPVAVPAGTRYETTVTEAGYRR